MNRRMAIPVAVAAVSLVLSILLVLHYQGTGGVYIGVYRTMSPKAANAVAGLTGVLHDEELNIQSLQLENARLKAEYLDSLEKNGRDPDVPQNFRLLITGLQ